MAFAKSVNLTVDLRETIPITAFCGFKRRLLRDTEERSAGKRPRNDIL